MRLFSPKEVIKKTASDEIRQHVLLKRLIEQNKEDLETVKARLDPEKQRLEREFVAFNTKVQSRKSALLKEVSDLEARRDKALEPLDVKWLELEERELDLDQRQRQLTAAKAELEAKTEALAADGDFLADKHLELGNREQAISALEKALSQLEAGLTAQRDDLGTQWKVFYEAEAALKLREAELGDIKALEARRAKAMRPLAELEAELATKAVELASERELLNTQGAKLTADHEAQSALQKVLETRTRELERLERTRQKEQTALAKAQAQQAQDKEALDAQRTAFLKESAARNEALKAEVLALEARAAEARRPLDEVKAALDVRALALDKQAKRLGSLTLKAEHEVEQLTEKAQTLTDQAKQLQTRETQVTKLENQAVKKTGELAAEAAALETNKERWTEAENTARLTLLEDERRNFDKERALGIIAESLDKREHDLDIYKQQLDDRAQTLESGFNELRHGTSS